MRIAAMMAEPVPMTVELVAKADSPAAMTGAPAAATAGPAQMTEALAPVTESVPMTAELDAREDSLVAMTAAVVVRVAFPVPMTAKRDALRMDVIPTPATVTPDPVSNMAVAEMHAPAFKAPVPWRVAEVMPVLQMGLPVGRTAAEVTPALQI